MKPSLRTAFMITGLCIWSGPNVISQCAGTPDMVIANAHIITMDPTKPFATTIAIRNGIIQAVGDMEDIMVLMPEDCPVPWIDAGGYTLLPGFNDAHCHWLSWPEHLCDAPGQAETTYPPLDVIMDTLSMHGWTSISELNFGRPDIIPEHLQHAMELEASGDLHVRINGYWGTYDQTELITVLQNYGYGPGHVFSDRIRAPGVKIYVDDPFGTMDIMDQATCTQLVTTAHNAGYQVAAHAVNQTAIEKILTAYETALGGANNYTARHRIEHAVKVSNNQFQRMEDEGIVASFQLMGPPDWPEQNTFQTYISNSNTNYILRWNDFVQSDIPVAGSTDAPFNNTVCHYSPFRAMYQAVTRMGYLDRTHAPWELNQRISIADALKLITIDGAWVTKEESVKGSLAVGKYADLTLVSADPLSVSVPEELLSIRSFMTMVGGDIEYCSEDMPGFCQPIYAFVVDSMIVTVSNYLSDQKPGRVFDKDEETNWGAGNFPPQHIQIDMLKNTQLKRIELVADQFPAGFTRHRLFGALDGQSLNPVLLHEFAGSTESLQTLAFNFEAGKRNFRYVKVATVQSPSWVSWREIRLSKEGTTGINKPQEEVMIAMNAYPNPTINGLTIELQIPQALDHAEITIISIDGRTSFRKNAGNLRAGIHKINIEPEELNALGAGNLIVLLKSQQWWSVSNVVRL
jgi:predicted amidohydrolase YtcJ